MAIIGAAIGLSFLAPYESYVGYALQAIVLLTTASAVVAFVRKRRVVPLLFSVLAAILIIFAYRVRFSAGVVYAGVAAIGLAAAWDLFTKLFGRRYGSPELQSVITCPECGHRTKEEMPTNACLFFYDCPSCGARLKPKPGDCCVFCSYGSVPCPPIQTGEQCCA